MRTRRSHHRCIHWCCPSFIILGFQMDLRCAICSKDFDEFERLPRVIPQCGHSYCEKCIKKSLQERKNIFICPEDNVTHFFRRQNDQLPRNIAIIKAIRDAKAQNIAKSRQNLVMKKYESDLSNSSMVCFEHQKPREFVCLEDRQTICAQCALFGHQVQNIAKPKSSKNLDDLFEKAMSSMESLSGQAQLILESPNVFVKSFDTLKRSLRSSIKQTFKAYHEIINRREAYVEKQLDEIIKNWQRQAEYLSDKVQSSHKDLIDLRDHLNLLEPQKEQSKRDPEVLGMELEGIIQKINQTEKNIDKINQQLSAKCRQYESQYKQRLEGAKFFKIQESAVDLTGSNAQNNRGKSREEHDFSMNLRNRAASHSISESREQNLKKQNMLPPKHNTNPALIRLGSVSKSRMLSGSVADIGNSTSLSKAHIKEDHSIDMASRGGSPSPIQKQEKEKRASGKAQVKKKIMNILEIISKTEGGSLQLLGLEIKDYYLQQIFDFIRKSGKKFGLIKLVKNQITDEGLATILEAVTNYQYLHTLNLTSNSLTQASLDQILSFSEKNKILKNFYLRNNSINLQKTKEKKKLMGEQGLNIFY